MQKKLILILSVMCTLMALASCKSRKKLAAQHNNLVTVYKNLKTEMPDAEVTMEGEKVKVVMPEAVLFMVNSAELNTTYLPILAKMSTVLNKYPETSILITGYTDATGAKEYNDQLSAKRAEKARDVLSAQKVALRRMHTWGLGSAYPVADNKTETGRRQNRRVEYVIMYDYKAGDEKK